MSTDLGNRYSKLLGETSTLSQVRSLEELLQLLARQAADLTDADRGTIFLAEPGEKALLSRVALEEDEALRVEIGQGIAGHVYKTGKALIVPDAYADPRFSPETDGKTGYRTKSLLCVPIRHLSRRTTGVFQVLNKRQGTFDELDVEILMGLGAHAAAAIEEVGARTERDAFVASLLDAHRSLEARVAQLDMLHEIEMALSRDDGPEELLKTLLNKLAHVFDSEAGAFLRPTARKDTLYFLTAWGPDADRLQNVTLEPGEGIASHVYRSGEPIISDNPASDPRFSPRIAAMIGFQTRNILCVPVESGGRRLGAMELLNHRHGPFSRQDVQAAELIARNIGSVLARQEEREQRRVRATMETLGSLVQGIAHDLRAPLGNLHLACKRMGEPGFDPARLPTLSSLMERQVQRCLSMTLDVLDFSRDSLSYTFEPLIAEALMEDLREMVERDVAERRIGLAFDIEPHCRLQADRSRLSRVFTNLVLNAVRVLGSGGSIRVSCRKDGERVIFAVEDDGPGVSEEMRERLFEPFNSGTKSTGLGLAISRRIVEGHGGQIWLDEGFSPGARFVVALPAATA